jgi:hypothetical protein
MPMGDPYDKLIDSPIADMKNVGPRDAGSITAAQFIKRFVEDGVRWAHLDIAGMVWASKPGTTWEKGCDRLWRAPARPLRRRKFRRLKDAGGSSRCRLISII